MEGKRLIRSLQLRSLLSYGPESEPFELQPLNVLIGPNASGKSNFLAGLSLLRGAATDFPAVIEERGSAAQWLWKGIKGTPVAELDAALEWPDEERPSAFKKDGVDPLRYHLEFTADNGHVQIEDEALEYDPPNSREDSPRLFLDRTWNPPMAMVQNGKMRDTPGGPQPVYATGPVLMPGSDQCFLSTRPEARLFPATGYVAQRLAAVNLYRDWSFGPHSSLRTIRQTSRADKYLREDGTNLGAVINSFRETPGSHEALVEQMKTVYERFEDIEVVSLGDFQFPQIKQTGMHTPIPLSAWSDGTLRFLTLLSILMHPDPPPLICVEEPELGLHPDMIRTVAKLLITASERMQLVVTTHSDLLVSCLRDIPEAVVICEYFEESTSLRRLSCEEISSWIEEESLGEAWLRGAFGGTRW